MILDSIWELIFLFFSLNVGGEFLVRLLLYICLNFLVLELELELELFILIILLFINLSFLI